MASRKTISDVVRSAAAGAMGVRELARAADVEPMTVSRFLRGGRIRSDKLDRLAQVLEIEVRQKRKG